MTTFTTIGGWATIVAVAGGLYYISSRNEKSRRPPIAKQVARAVETTKGKAKKAKKAVLQSDGDSDVKSGGEKRKTKKAAAPKAEPQQQSYAAVADDKDEVDNHEFARQLEAAKTGTSFTSKSKTETRAKSVKQNKAHDKPVVEQSSDNLTASSTNGADGDDDQSPVQSPNLSATTGGGVADMLEKPSGGPSVLKISAPTQPALANKKPKKQEESAETKKARQNRQKAEALKAQRAADEAERVKLMEQQRRTARIAEGRAAKDGSSSQASKPPANNSWTVPPATTNGVNTSDKKVQLLDTTEQPTPNNKEQGTKWNTSISEEEQIRLINENESWETVKKDKKARQKKEQGKVAESSADEAPKTFGAPKRSEPATGAQTYNSGAPSVAGNKKIPMQDIAPEEDEWEVS